LTSAAATAAATGLCYEQSSVTVFASFHLFH